MQSAIENAEGNSTQRAWQSLPRSLRRRAASHDVRRVPVRLRDKARAEVRFYASRCKTSESHPLQMDPAKRKAIGRKLPKRGKSKQVNRTLSFLKRQRQ